MEFTAKEVFALFRKRFIIVIICTLAGLSIFFILTRYVMNPSYTATAQLYVNSKDSTDSADINDLNYAQKAVNTYISFLQTKVFYNRVREESRLPYSPEQLRRMTKINSINSTEIFEISVTSDNAEISYELVSIMQEIAPELIKSIKPSAEISVVDPAIVPGAPSGPNLLLNTATGGIVGFILAVLAIFLLEIIDVNVKGREELKKKYNRPILGEIPDYSSRKIKEQKIFSNLTGRASHIFFHRFRKNIWNNQEVAEDHDFMISEAYKALRANLRYTLCGDGCKKVLINSPVSMDGKSTVCAGIGIAIAQTGAKVLLVDCDLRRGRLHNIFKLKSSPGVSELLSGLAKDKDVLQDTGYENLHVITMGAIPPNPAELLSLDAMEEFMLYQENYYDYIIFDSPPVNIVADSLSLLKLVDGMVIVVRENYTSHPNIATAITKYELVGANILGFVLNGISMNQDNRSKSQYYSYRSKHD